MASPQLAAHLAHARPGQALTTATLTVKIKGKSWTEPERGKNFHCDRQVRRLSARARPVLGKASPTYHDKHGTAKPPRWSHKPSSPGQRARDTARHAVLQRDTVEPMLLAAMHRLARLQQQEAPAAPPRLVFGVGACASSSPPLDLLCPVPRRLNAAQCRFTHRKRSPTTCSSGSHAACRRSLRPGRGAAAAVALVAARLLFQLRQRHLKHVGAQGQLLVLHHLDVL